MTAIPHEGTDGPGLQTGPGAVPFRRGNRPSGREPAAWLLVGKAPGGTNPLVNNASGEGFSPDIQVYRVI